MVDSDVGQHGHVLAQCHHGPHDHQLAGEQPQLQQQPADGFPALVNDKKNGQGTTLPSACRRADADPDVSIFSLDISSVRSARWQQCFSHPFSEFLPTGGEQQGPGNP